MSEGDGFITVTSKRKKRKPKKRDAPNQHFRNHDNRPRGNRNYRGRSNRRGGYRNERREERPRVNERPPRKIAIPIGGSQYRAQHNTSRGLWSDQARVPAPQPTRKAQYVEELPVEQNPVPANPVNPDEIFEDDFEDDQIEQNVAVAAPVILEPIAIEENDNAEENKTTIEFQGIDSPDNPEEIEDPPPNATVVEPVEVPPEPIEEKREEDIITSLVKDKPKPASPVGWSWMGSKPKDPPALSDSTPSDKPLQMGLISSLDPETLKKTAIKQVEAPKETAPAANVTTQPIPQPTWYPNQHNPYMEAGFNNSAMVNMQAGNTMGYVVPGAMVMGRPQQYMMPGMVMGASPAPMMQNHMAPGLPAVFNHPNPYQMNYRPMLVRNNQMGGGAPTANAGNNANANNSQKMNPATRSQNLLHYNAIPHNTVPVYSEYIRPTHRPRQGNKKQQRVAYKTRPRIPAGRTSPKFKSWGEMFAYTDDLKKSPGRIITKFLTFRDLFTCFFVLNKEIAGAKKHMPLLENLGVSTFSMFNINTDLPSWNIYKHFGREKDTVKQFFDEWSPFGLRDVTVETSVLDDENFIMLTNYLRRCPKLIRQLTISSVENDQFMNELSLKNLKDLLRDIHCGHLVIDGVCFKIDGNFLKLLQDRIRELTVLSETFQWEPYLISQLPSRLSGLTICCPQVSWIGVRDTLPSDLKRLYIRASPGRRITDVEVERLFQKLPHLQFDFSLLHQFVKPNSEIYTAIQRLDLFFDRDARPMFESIFCNLPLSLRIFSISYTGHAHNALEGWWKTLSEHTCAHLEELELKDFDVDGLEDTVRMFQAKKFPKLKRVLFVTIAYTARNCEERLRAELPSSCELIVKKSETQI